MLPTHLAIHPRPILHPAWGSEEEPLWGKERTLAWIAAVTPNSTSARESEIGAGLLRIQVLLAWLVESESPFPAISLHEAACMRHIYLPWR